MCKWNTTLILDIPAHPDWKRHVINGRKKIDVDSCIADIVLALNNGGVFTIACCCGHYKGPGMISLQDGRQLLIVDNMDNGLKLIDIARERGMGVGV